MVECGNLECLGGRWFHTDWVGQILTLHLVRSGSAQLRAGNQNTPHFAYAEERKMRNTSSAQRETAVNTEQFFTQPVLAFWKRVSTSTVGAKEILTLLKRRKKFTAKQGIKFHIPLSLLSVGRV